MITAPLAMAGALLGLYFTGQTLNLYSKLANQLRDQERELHEAMIEAADTRFRPIVMTGTTTAAGSIPLIVSSGTCTETR